MKIIPISEYQEMIGLAIRIFINEIRRLRREHSDQRIYSFFIDYLKYQPFETRSTTKSTSCMVTMCMTDGAHQKIAQLAGPYGKILVRMWYLDQLKWALCQRYAEGLGP